jgi:hypothetical protein
MSFGGSDLDARFKLDPKRRKWSPKTKKVARLSPKANKLDLTTVFH